MTKELKCKLCSNPVEVGNHDRYITRWRGKELDKILDKIDMIDSLNVLMMRKSVMMLCYLGTIPRSGKGKGNYLCDSCSMQIEIYAINELVGGINE